LLLDTHIWLWMLGRRQQLRPTVLAALADARNELWLSPVSVWEYLLLAEKNRLGFVRPGGAREWLAASLVRIPMAEAPLTRDIVVRSREFALSHADPADRFLAATADVYGLTLVTSDRRLLAGTGYRTLANL
jgi:PIN domain nuclease of toxin-antitoxin system